MKIFIRIYNFSFQRYKFWFDRTASDQTDQIKSTGHKLKS